MSRRHESAIDDPDISAELVEHHNFVVVPADKASPSNTIVFVCVCLQYTLYQLLKGGAWYECDNMEPNIRTHYAV